MKASEVWCAIEDDKVASVGILPFESYYGTPAIRSVALPGLTLADWQKVEALIEAAKEQLRLWPCAQVAYEDRIGEVGEAFDEWIDSTGRTECTVRALPPILCGKEE
jgi:hypothetical protein